MLLQAIEAAQIADSRQSTESFAKGSDERRQNHEMIAQAIEADSNQNQRVFQQIIAILNAFQEQDNVSHPEDHGKHFRSCPRALLNYNKVGPIGSWRKCYYINQMEMSQEAAQVF